jgi:hypothetical protein
MNSVIFNATYIKGRNNAAFLSSCIVIVLAKSDLPQKRERAEAAYNNAFPCHFSMPLCRQLIASRLYWRSTLYF